MTHTLLIETQDVEGLELLKAIAQKMGFRAEEKKFINQEVTDLGHSNNEALNKFLEVQKRYPPRRVPNDIDINEIIDEVNNTGYVFAHDAKL